MITEIRDHGFDDLTDTRILSFLNDTYFDVCAREPWPFLEKQSALTVNASGVVTSPTDISKIISIVNTTENMPKLLPWRLDTFTKAYGARLTEAGDPYIYYFLGETLNVWPIPSSATLTARYIRVPAALTVTPDSSPILPARHHRVIVLGSLVKCMNMEDDAENAAVFTNLFEQRLMQMRNDLWMQQYDRTDTIQDLDGADEVDWLY